VGFSTTADGAKKKNGQEILFCTNLFKHLCEGGEKRHKMLFWEKSVVACCVVSKTSGGGKAQRGSKERGWVL
jgi:hypothetical protein